LPNRQKMPVKDAAQVAQKLADELQLELVDVELVKEPTGRFLRFFVEKEDGISVNELEAFHRRLQPLVERVDYDYMEVSSPGADRPLKTERDFERAAGLRVELSTYRPVNGAKRFAGELKGLVDGQIVLLVAGAELSFSKKDVAVVRPVVEFDEKDLEDDCPVGEQ
jgi:ribosome maturation factor RimP